MINMQDTNLLHLLHVENSDIIMSSTGMYLTNGIAQYIVLNTLCEFVREYNKIKDIQHQINLSINVGTKFEIYVLNNIGKDDYINGAVCLAEKLLNDFSKELK